MIIERPVPILMSRGVRRGLSGAAQALLWGGLFKGGLIAGGVLAGSIQALVG